MSSGFPYVHFFSFLFLLLRKAHTHIFKLTKHFLLCLLDLSLLEKPTPISSMLFPVAMYRCKSWTIKKDEHRRTDAFELWCWIILFRVPWTAWRSNQSILREISPEYSLEGLMLTMKLQYFGHLIPLTCTLKNDCCCCSVAELCPTLCDPMDCSTPGLFVLHHLLVCSNSCLLSRWYHPTISSSVVPSASLPAFNLSQHEDLFQWVSSWNQVAKVLEFQL